MIDLRAKDGRFCWVDLAAADTGRAAAFYETMFGWTSQRHAANGGSFNRLRLSGRDVGSMYQLNKAHLERGVPSHWTPYVRVSDAGQAAERAVALGGQILVRPFVVSNVARIALILDAVGAQVGLWESVENTGKIHG